MATEIVQTKIKSMDLLRFATAGSVDDGKSTLIGRLLFDSKSIFADQLEAVERTSEQKGHGYVDLSLLTDGLRSEREQGITIDVAYRYFATPNRKFIIADTPGHIQYTRNMVTGASTADLGLVLVDARQGLTEQSRRHAVILSLLRVPHLVLAVNKMDLVDFDQKVYEKIHDEFTQFATKLSIPDLEVIPISALAGDNVVNRSENMPWYSGPTLMHHLEHVHVASDRDLIDARFPVQYVVRPKSDEFHDYRGYAGQVAGGVEQRGQLHLAAAALVQHAAYPQRGGRRLLDLGEVRRRDAAVTRLRRDGAEALRRGVLGEQVQESAQIGRGGLGMLGHLRSHGVTGTAARGPAGIGRSPPRFGGSCGRGPAYAAGPSPAATGTAADRSPAVMSARSRPLVSRAASSETTVSSAARPT